MGEIVKASDIMVHVNNGAVDPGLAVEDMPKEVERWSQGQTAGDRAVVTALKAVEEGRQLVDIFEVLRRGGRDNKRMPKLALAPAFRKQVRSKAFHDGTVRYATRGWKFEVDTAHTWSRNEAIWAAGIATAPIMPPEVRAIANKKHLVLWEATWRQTRVKVPRPPIDPALLEHVSGSLYAVVKTWDLTELEAAALQ